MAPLAAENKKNAENLVFGANPLLGITDYSIKLGDVQLMIVQLKKSNFSLNFFRSNAALGNVSQP